MGEFKLWLEAMDRKEAERLFRLMQTKTFWHFTKQRCFRPHPNHESQCLQGVHGLYLGFNKHRWRGWAKDGGLGGMTYRYIAEIDLSRITLSDIMRLPSYDHVWADEDQIYIPPKLVPKVKVIGTEAI